MAERADVDVFSCARWMLARQTTWIDDNDEDQSEDRNPTEDLREQAQPSNLDMSLVQASSEPQEPIAGFCGRSGKIADTCYCFWNVGALAVRRSKRALAQAN